MLAIPPASECNLKNIYETNVWMNEEIFLIDFD